MTRFHDRIRPAGGLRWQGRDRMRPVAAIDRPPSQLEVRPRISCASVTQACGKLARMAGQRTAL